MRLYLMRHALAEETSENLPDELRALTSKGRKRAQRVARWLRSHGERPDRVFASPLVRAVQTAEIVHGALGLDEPVTIDAILNDPTIFSHAGGHDRPSCRHCFQDHH